MAVATAMEPVDGQTRMTQKPPIIISASDEKYFPLLIDLLDSIRDWPHARGLLDLGLNESQRRELRARGVIVAAAKWDIESPALHNAPPWFMAMTARPFLRDYFPNHNIYVWLDSDLWVQNMDAIADYMRVAESGALAITPEIDRCYWRFHKRAKLWGLQSKAMAWAYGFAAGNKLGKHVILNAGAFALAHDAPHWDLWQAAMRRGLNRTSIWPRVKPWDKRIPQMIDQTALSYVVYADRAKTGLLPAIYNWIAGLAAPLWDADRKCWAEPEPPHAALGLVHLAGCGKDRPIVAKTSDGGHIETLLTFAATQKLKSAD